MRLSMTTYALLTGLVLGVSGCGGSSDGGSTASSSSSTASVSSSSSSSSLSSSVSSTVSSASSISSVSSSSSSVSSSSASSVAPVTTPLSVNFNAIDLPDTPAGKAALRATTTLSVDGTDATFDYNEIMHTGYRDNGEVFGGVKDKDGNLITFGDGSPYICNGTNDGVGSGLDFSSILQRDGKLYMINQFECSIGAMYMTELQQESNGSLTPKAGTLHYIPQGDFGGWTHCAGMVTPWQSHLGSEEYESDARDVEANGGDTYYNELKLYWKDQFGSISPYYYGWITETTIESGTPVYAKHFSMGRFSHEMAYVMPDSKTVYMADDGTNVGFYMYIADTAGDLSAGTLYAAKFNQRERNRGGAFDLSWVALAHASDSDVKSIVASKPAFSDIFETADPLCGAICPDGFDALNTSAGQECLKVKSGMDMAAAFLETRRYAALKGATTELRKEEGIDYDPVHNRLFVAISEISKGMEDNRKYGAASTQYDQGGSNDIRLPLNSCGGVYALSLAPDGTIGSDYVAQRFDAVLVGEAKEYKDTAYEGNSCDIDKIANPDNLTYLGNTDTLIVAEDSGNHINNIVWAFDLKTATLTRIATMPVGAEATSTGYYRALGDYSYLTLVNQHPSDLKNCSIGTFRVKEHLNPAYIPQSSETACNAKSGFTWNVQTQRCEAAMPSIDYKTPGAGDTASATGSCYTTGEGTVFGSDFECGLIQPWSIYSASSDIDWEYAPYNNGCAKITGYGADDDSDDWLISPEFTFIGDETLSFDYALNYSGSVCTVLVSTDYSGSGDPEAATWETVTTYTESKGNWNFYPSGEFNLSQFGGKKGYIAFHHTNVKADGSGTWEIDNIEVKGNGEVFVPFQAAMTLSSTALLRGEYFELSSNVSGGSAPYGFAWDLGNGDTSDEAKFCYKYDSEGNYTIALQVTDGESSTADAAPQSVEVNEPLDEKVPANTSDIRIATYNAYLNRTALGELETNLQSGTDSQIKNVANIIQQVNPDVLLINEFDYNGETNPDLLRTKYFGISQDGNTPITFPYVFVAPSNTGIQSSLDYNGDGKYNGDDCFGYGDFEGQYAMVFFSKYPINSAKIRTFQTFRWKDMPEHLVPMKDGVAYFSNAVMDIYRLSSKNHWDIPVDVNGKIFHVLASHPTPPTFDDGDKDGSDNTEDLNLYDWNGLRNHDEIRLWSDYVKNESNYLYDDNGTYGGLPADTRFVIMGDQNADPDEGDSYDNAIMQLLDNPMINATVTPTSKGATSEGVSNREEDDTANWSMRADYVLPSRYGFAISDCGVYWPQQSDIKHTLVEQSASGGENSSDHRLVWCDLNITDINVSGGEDNATSALSSDFEEGTLDGWSAVSLSGDKTWEPASYGGLNYAYMNGYGDTAASDDWLVSPLVMFDGTQTLTFISATRFDGPDLTVMISTDYDGSGDINAATWQELTTLPSVNDNFTWHTWSISLTGYSVPGYIAFHYTSTGTDAGDGAGWEVDDVVVAP